MKKQQRAPIPKIEWLDLEPEGLADDPERFEYKRPAAGLGYTSVRFPRAELETLWPAGSSLSDTKAKRAHAHKPTHADKKEFVRANEDAVRQSGFGMTKDETIAWAQKQNISAARALLWRRDLPKGMLRRQGQRRNGL